MSTEDPHGRFLIDPLTLRRLVKISAISLLIVLTLNAILNGINYIFFAGELEIPIFWPVSVFALHTGVRGACLHLGILSVPCPPLPLYLGAIGSSIGLFIGTAYYLSYRKANVVTVIGAAAALVLLTNLINGYQAGVVVPVAGGSVQYYHDAIRVVDPVLFVANFEDRLPNLLLHSRTHPPGAVLLFYFLKRVFRTPEVISIAIALFSIPTSGYFLYKLLRTSYEQELATYVTFLFLILPTVQIYYLSTIDAVIASLVLGAVLSFVQTDHVYRIVGTSSFAFLASFLTHVALPFLFPVLFAYEFLRERSVSSSLLVLLVVSTFYIVLYVSLGYNHIASFVFASTFENPEGFRLFSSPLNYFLTRFEDIMEILVFFTPSLVYVLHLQFNEATLRDILDGEIVLFAGLAIGVLLGMLGAGLYRTGETARAAIYIYPFLMVVVCDYLSRRKLRSDRKFTLASVIFLQTVLMQIIGFYAW